MVFSATTTTVVSKAGTIANGANTESADATQLDNSTELYPYAKAVLGIPDTFAAAPTAGGTVDLYMIEDDIDGTSDETPIPAASDILYLARYVGSWVVDNQDVAVIKPIVISLEGVKKARFFILNNTGQQISYASSPTTVKVTPFTVAPA